MNLSRLDEEVLQLINSYSTNGNIISSSDNADYLLRTRNLIDMCQKELASIIKIEASTSIVLDNIATKGNYSEISLPTDFKEIKSVYLQNDYYKLLSGYILNNKKLLIKSDLEGTLIINYYKVPTAITKDTDAEFELEISEDVQQLIPFYVGGWVFMGDNPTIGAMLVNEYKEKVKMLKNLPSVPIDIIDVYEGDDPSC